MSHLSAPRRLGAQFAPSFHRPWLRYADPVPGAEAGTPAGEATASPAAPETAPATPAPTAPVPAPPAPAQPATGAPADASQSASQPDDVASLPEWAQKLIKDGRKEAQSLRQRQEQAVTDATSEITAKLGKALGLIEDDTPPDPEQLVASAAADREAARTARVELAVHRAAPSRDIAELLLDSRAFAMKVTPLDPSADDFAAQVADVVQAEVSANPSRYRTQAPAAPANSDGAPVTGHPAPSPTSVESLRASYAEARGERP